MTLRSSTEKADLGRSFRHRFSAGERLIGTFVKTPSPHIIEILAAAGFDFVVIDEEHAPFDRTSIDNALLAAAAAGIPALVRPSDRQPARLLAMLDDGAAGILAPHVGSAADARALANACLYSGSRSYSNAPRAGRYGTRQMWEHVAARDEATTVIAMVEDLDGIAAVPDILAVDGIAGLFIGRADLAVSLNDRVGTRVSELTDSAIDAAIAANKPVCLFVQDPQEVDLFAKRGVTTFILSSDQSLLRQTSAAQIAACTSGGQP